MQKQLLPLVLAVLVAFPTYAQSLPPATGATPHIARAQAAEPLGRLTLAAALDLALKASLEIAVARREIEATEGPVRQAGIIPNPEIAALVEDTRQATRTTTVQLNQLIELGGKRTARVAAAERGRDIASIELAGKQAEVRALVISAFYDVVTAQERYRLAEDVVELAQHATRIAARRVAAGKISPVEETRVRVAESGVRVDQAQAAADLESARRRLAATWGSVAPGFERAEDRADALPLLPSLSELTGRLQQAPALRRARMEVDRRQALARVERTRQIPNITVSIGAKRDEQLGRNQALVGLSVPLPLFDRNQGNVLETLRRTDKARDELIATEVSLTSELGQAHGRLNATRNEAELVQREILPGAQSAYEATSKGFELGKFSFLEVLDAQRTYFQAKSQYLRALAEAHRAAAGIERLLGQPSAVIQ